MAFKMKNPSVMKMAKQAGAGMKMKAPMKMGHSPKKVMKGDGRAESSSFQMKEKAAMKMKKAAMKLKKESAMMLKKSAMEMKKASAMKDKEKGTTLPEVTVKDYETRARVLKKGYLEKDGKYYKKPADKSFYAYGKDNEVPASEALQFKRKSKVSPDDKVLGKATKIGEGSYRQTGKGK